MFRFKILAAFAFAILLATNCAVAQPGYHHPHHHHRYYYGYGPAYAPVVLPPPPPPAAVLYAPGPILAPVPIAPPPMYVTPAPVYVPQTYSYGAVGPRGHAAFGYSSPGFGIYLGR